MCSGRSYNDIAQYPVYPWVLSNYSSDYIDLQDVNNYRDLSKPIGSLNEERIEKLLMQYEEIKNDPCEACLYRVHYSTPGFVIYYLIRCEPFTSLHISLQQGRFDHPGRLFQSIQNSWESCISTNTDFRELIPEFYSSNEFLLNTEKFDLGDGINDVILPKWANSAIHFIYLNRIALESPYVSKNIHKWIDLIFGCKQQDLKSLNLFHPFSDSRSMTNYYNDNDRLLMIMNHAANLGVIPSKLFSQAHSDREFIPLVPDFTNTQKLLFCVEFHDINAIKMWISPNNTISYIQIDGIVKNISSAQNEKGKLPLNISSSNPINVVAKVNMKLPIALAQREIVHNFISVIPGKKIIISSPWSGTFDIFDIKGNLHFSSDDEKANITAITADKNVIISSAQDASLTVWDLKSGYKKSYLHAHSHRISCIAYSSDIDLIVSADISGKLSYSSAISCKCERSMQLEVIPTHLKISNLGIVLVFYETEVSGSVTTTIESYDLSQRFIEACKISGKITASCICEFQDYSQYLFVTTSSLKVHLMCIFELTKRVAFGEITSPVECCVFHKEKHTLYLTQKNGILVSYRFVNYE
ncbi:hypothetical protein TRFO_10659 [Tritrichomonas foetus]|uniref:BEACH domain-containing protein n=1 Tax=Tritrichomonas foetus TaxID=1144522 RepID=A0A1J4JBZ0_9EUKA|nr:hypothetical protein TRFO_10659 [Tritrichomonas foetus]|eukprot:OHS95171.1 hypothetical protein TRFO_10659 [Tritrichomonas foetus]